MRDIKPVPARPSIDIPILETARLRLRACKLDDLGPLSAAWSDPAATRYIGAQTRSRADIWKQMQQSIGGWALLGYGYWTIADKKTDHPIGQIGFLEGLRPITPSFVGKPEAGWFIARDHWGRGIASEALSAALDWVDANIPISSTVCIIEADHAVSIHIAEKFGYRFAETGQLPDGPISIYERPRGGLPE
ncbi:MAG: GNAT family N-acetyltransferase [Pseudomonadota bacterium]